MSFILNFLKSFKFLVRFPNYYFYILFALIFFKVLINTTNGSLYGDFWEHSAVIQALTANLRTPFHPFFALQIPHAFISPYHFIVALFSKITGLDVITSLGIFSILNFCLFIFGLNFFIKGFVANKIDLTSFFALLFILFLWGYQPWGYSGFFHFGLLGNVLPYPSTFATALSFVGLGLGFKLKWPHSFLNLLFLTLISTLVLLVHPLTFIFLATGLLCQATFCKKILTAIFFQLFIFAIAIGIAMLWPYFSVFALLTGASDVYHASNQTMYVGVVSKIWPILLLSPLLLPAFKNKATHPIFLHVLALIAVFFYGGFTGKYSYGRDISFIVMLVQILLASQFAHFESQLSQTYPRAVLSYRAVLCVTLLCLASFWLYPTFTRSLTVLNSIVSGRTISNQITYKNLTFLPQHLKRGSVVLSDLETSWLVPSFGGKVIGALHVQAFVPDDEQRRVDLLDFFGDDTSTAKRQSIIEKYKPDYFLINKRSIKNWKLILNEVNSFSKTTLVYENDQYLLFRFD